MKDEARQEARRVKLREIIETRWPSVTAFAKEIGRSQSQIQDMLDRRKPFGDKMARYIEKAVNLKTNTLLEPGQEADAVRDSAIVYGSPISPEAALLGREWDKLVEPWRSNIVELIHILVAAQVRNGRRPPRKPTRGRRDDASYDRPT